MSHSYLPTAATRLVPSVPRKLGRILDAQPPVELPRLRAILVVDRAAAARELIAVLADQGFDVDLRFGAEEPAGLEEVADGDLIVIDNWDEFGGVAAFAQRFGDAPEALQRTVIIQTPTLGLSMQAHLMRLGVRAILPRNRFADRLAGLGLVGGDSPACYSSASRLKSTSTAAR